MNRSELLLYCLLSLFLVFPFQRLTAQGNTAGGFEYGITYTGDLFGNVRGGYDTGFKYMDNIDLELSLDTDEAFGWGLSEIYLYGLGNQGGSISGLVGDIQGISNIEAETSWRLYEAWYQQYVYNLRSSLLVGLYDLNAEFDLIDTASLFINSSHGIGAEYAISGVMGPSIFPYTSMAARLQTNPLRGVILRAAVLDGIPSDPGNTDGTKVFFRPRDGMLLAGEMAFHPQDEFESGDAEVRDMLSRGSANGKRYKVALGGWMYTKERLAWGGGSQRNWGIYVLGEYQLLQEQSGSDQGLSGFLRYGVANDEVNRLASYLGSGLVYTGLFPERPEDQIGIAMALAVNSPEYRHRAKLNGNPTARYEMNIETTYGIGINEFVMLQFDLQYIIDPGLTGELKNAVALGARMRVSL